MTKDSKERREEDKLKERKKIKDAPLTKVVIRRLPPTLTEENFVEQISPMPQNDYFCFVKAERCLAPFAFSRAYLNFTSQEDIISFSEKWDGHVFLDTNGREYVAVVEFAPYTKVPKKPSSRKVDPRSGTIEDDDDYKKFLESLEVTVEPLPSAETFLEEIEQKNNDKKAIEMTTPLLDYLKNKRAERIKAREDAKEERKRKEQERQKRRDEERRKKREEERKKKIKEREEREKRKEKETEQKEDTSVKILKNDVSKEEVRSKSKSDVKDRTRKEDSRTSSPKVESKEDTIKEKDFDKQKSSRISEKERDKERFRGRDGGKDKGRYGGGRTPEPIKDRYKDKEKEREKPDSRSNSSRARDTAFSKDSKRKFDDRRDRKSLSSTPSKEKLNNGFGSKEKKDEVKQKLNDSSGNKDKKEEVKKNLNDGIGSKEKKDEIKKASRSPDIASTQKLSDKEKVESTPTKKSADERGKGPRIRNKDRPAMQIYRPGQRSIIKSTSPSTDTDTSSSKSASPEKSKRKTESPTNEKAKDPKPQRGQQDDRPRTGETKAKAEKSLDKGKDDRSERNKNFEKGSNSGRYGGRRDYKREDDKKRHWDDRPRDSYRGGRWRDDRGRDDRGRDDRRRDDGGKDDKKKDPVKDTNKAKATDTKES
ncbi:regulator of nonsense transcripts 3B-like [Anneissia japonica]|uniref:regulator of nonsense transcripts 3B-like n=1 Tax=Anneissia japonica TaxID=1529436 RepID=UPI0014258936|nr:regulator of nonsense transcripts 3B-like [Anneissia japonica]